MSMSMQNYPEGKESIRLTNESGTKRKSRRAFANSPSQEDSGQPRHRLSLYGVIAVRTKRACVLRYPTQTGLCSAHTQFVFHVMTQTVSNVLFVV